MANETGFARTNYFRVKDQDAFRQFVESCAGEVTIVTKDKDASLIALLASEGYWPSTRIDEETDEEQDIVFLDEVANHLADGQICIVMEAGFCGGRYCYGEATAFDNAGRQTNVSLADIYAAAERKFAITGGRAEY